MSAIQIAIFLDSSSGPPEHQSATTILGRAIAETGHKIIYGDTHVNLMKLLTDTALTAGNEMVGILPQNLIEQKIGHRSLTRLKLVGTIHERKTQIANLANTFVALPDSTNTLDELIEIMTWSQLGLHAKPITLYNVNNF